MRILHIVPQSAQAPDKVHQGSTKDIRSRTEYFQSRGFVYEEQVVDRSDGMLLRLLRQRSLAGITHVVLEYTLYPSSMAYLRQQHPGLRVFARAINAEFYHRLHRLWLLLMQPKWFPGARPHRVLLEGLSHLKLDWHCASLSHQVWAITAWEQRYYWHYVAGAAKSQTVPFFLPTDYLNQIPATEPKQNHCVCLMSDSSSPTPFLADAAHNFARLVGMLNSELPHWQFSITGSPSSTLARLPTRVAETGLLASPYAFLGRTRAAAVLTDYGFGFKTKILEAICARNFVLVTRKLFQRLPEAVKPYCKIVDLKSSASFAQALRECEQPCPDGDPNSHFKQQAFEALDSAFASDHA